MAGFERWGWTRLLRNGAEAVNELGAVELLCLGREAGVCDGRFHFVATFRKDVQHLADIVRRNAERLGEFEEVGRGIEAEAFVARREAAVGEEVEPCGRRLVREVNRRVQEVVRRCEDVVALWRFVEREVLEVRVAVREDVVEEDEEEDLRVLDGRRRTEPTDEPGQLLVACVILVVLAVRFLASVRELAEVLLAYLHAISEVEALREVAVRAVGELDQRMLGRADAEDVGCDVHRQGLVRGDVGGKACGRMGRDGLEDVVAAGFDQQEAAARALELDLVLHA